MTIREYKIDFVIPIYNEASNVEPLIARLDTVAAQIEAEFDATVGFVFVDDGSKDDSFQRLSNHDFGNRAVTIRKLSRNFGKEAALSAGIEAATGCDAAILMDADLQHPPELAIDFVRTWLETGADSVYAYKSDRRGEEGILKDLLARFFFWVINRDARFFITPNMGDFRLINRDFMAALLSLPESERFMKGLYGWIGFQQVGLPFKPADRQHGESNFPFVRMLLLTLDAITSFSVTPLRLMTLSGLIIAVLSTIYGIFIIIERLFIGTATNGFASVLVLVSFFGGAQMIFLGLLGEYVGKAVIEAKRRPNYIVAKDLTRNHDDSK